MPRPRLFVGSSSESLPIAYGVHENLQQDFEVTVWRQGAFLLNRAILEELVRYSREMDAAVMVFSNDDVAQIRGTDVSVTRDNVVFELGLFLGSLGRDSAFVLAPYGEDLHLPSDLAGIMVAHYDASRADKNWTAATGPACNRILQAFGQSAPNRRATASAESDAPSFAPTLEWLLAQLSSPERQALIQMIHDGVLEYTAATKNNYKQLRNLGLARTATNKSLKHDTQLVPTPLGEYVVRILATRA